MLDDNEDPRFRKSVIRFLIVEVRHEVATDLLFMRDVKGKNSKELIRTDELAFGFLNEVVSDMQEIGLFIGLSAYARQIALGLSKVD